MKKINPLLILACFACLSLFSSCDSATGDDDADGTGDSLGGTWLKVFPSPYFDYDGTSSAAVAESMVMEIGESAYSMVFYYDTVQVGGNRGTYTLAGGKMKCAVTHEWNDKQYWVAAAPNTVMEFPYTVSGETATLTAGSQQIALTKTVFAKHSGFPGTWNSGTETMTFASDGTFTWTDTAPDPDDTQSGTWDVSGTTSGFLRTVATAINGSAASYGSLSPYVVKSATTVDITYESIPDPDVTSTFTKQ